MPGLSGKTFVLELGREIRFKAKQELINYLREQNAQISYILTASTDYVLVSNDVDTYKTRRASQLGIPLVNVQYIYEYQKASTGKESIDIKRFFVTSAEDKENFAKTGTVPVPGSGRGGSSAHVSKLNKFDPSRIKIWNADDAELPFFDELTHAEIGKWAIFKETNDHSDVYFVLELQIVPEEFLHQTTNDYRYRFRYEKQTLNSSMGKSSVVQYAFSTDISELQQLFATYYSRIATMPRITRFRDSLPDKLGSKLLLRSLFLNRLDTQTLDDDVCQLIESLWLQSIGDLNQILSVPPESIALQTIIEAEAALLEIKSNSESSAAAQTRFYELIPHQSLFTVDLIKDRRALVDKIDLCQMLRDLQTVNELTNWNVKASIEAKYRALKCHIESLSNDSQEYQTLAETIASTTHPNEQVIIHHIYSVTKQTDALNFRSTLFNQRQLFHGSKYQNFLGILSRGLLLPKAVVTDFGVTRTDFGCLGYGLYFSDSVSTSLKYTTASTTRRGRRLLCVSQVALGESAKYYSYAPTLTEPPANYHSTHGVKRTEENNSKFLDDEFVVYHLDQQRLVYLVEVSWIPHDQLDKTLVPLPILRDVSVAQPIGQAEIPSTIEDEVIPVAEQDYGLICPSSGQLVPLKAFHVRAQLIDVTAQVTLYQVYRNTSSVPIEAKYVFPLDENSSVCGFEAHINNKVIKGVVKEKEQAKREYREAIEKGHGAYLMHQEQPEVFSVSVGNLPANCEVIIKITYVAELAIENSDIIFRLPAKVASWQSKQALESKDQTLLPSIDLQSDKDSMKSVEFSLKAAIRMPYEIAKLFSPTHRLRRKLTDCLAMVEMVDNVLLEKDFILSLTLKNVHLPRLMNETFALTDENNNFETVDENSQASMLTFYPKFDLPDQSNECVEIIFVVDVSNSMDGKHVQQAKQLAHLFLTTIKPEQTNTYFNIVTFGSDNDECFPISAPTTRENLEKGKQFILHSLIHRGTTDLFSVLRRYALLPSLSKSGRQYIILSDGHINDLSSVLTLLHSQGSLRHDRLFTCAIGDTVNKHHLKQLANGANAGGLVTIFDSNYRSRWKTKVTNLLENIRQPCVTNIQIEWHGTVDQQQEVFTSQAPKIIRSLFNGMRLTVYRFIQNCHKVTLTAMINDQEFSTVIFSNKMTETKGKILHCLTARAIIEDYENGLLHVDETECELLKKKYKQDLIDLSIKYSVVSSFTSFVAIEERDGQPLEPGVHLLNVMLENDLDLLPYMGWDGDRSQRDILKEKLINGKQSLINASLMTKEDLSRELEALCDKISYRAGGEAKFELMTTLIQTYRKEFNAHEKARALEEKLERDLCQEIDQATAEERTMLEEKLRSFLPQYDPTNDADDLVLQSRESFTRDLSPQLESDDMMDDDLMVLEECSSREPVYDLCALMPPKQRKSMNRATSWESVDDDSDDSYLNSPRTSMKACAYEKKEEEEAEDDMGFGLFADFDEGENVYQQAQTVKRHHQTIVAEELKPKPSMVVVDEGSLRQSGFGTPKMKNEVRPLDKFTYKTESASSAVNETASTTSAAAAFSFGAINADPSSFGTTSAFTTSKKSLLSAETPPTVSLFGSTPTTTGSFGGGFSALQQFSNPSAVPTFSFRASNVSTSDTIFGNQQMRTPIPPPSVPGALFSAFAPPSGGEAQSNLSRLATSGPPPPPPLLPTPTGFSFGAPSGSLFQPNPTLTSTGPPPAPPPPTTGFSFGAPSGSLFQPNPTLTSTAPPPPPPPPAAPVNFSFFAARGLSNQSMPAFYSAAAPSSVAAFSSPSYYPMSSSFVSTAVPSAPERGSGFPPSTSNREHSLMMHAHRSAEAPQPLPPIAVHSPQYSSMAGHGGMAEGEKRDTPSGCMSGGSSRGRRVARSPTKPLPASTPTVSQSAAQSLQRNLDDITSILHKNITDTIERGCQLDNLEDNLRTANFSVNQARNQIKTKEKEESVSMRLKKVSVKKDPVATERLADLLLLDVTPLSIGVEDIHGQMCRIIERNRTIPTRTEFYPVFTNAHAHQTTATIRIFEGEHKLTQYNNFLAEFHLSGLTQNFASQTLVISISMDIDANGLLYVEAVESQSGAKASTRITTEKGRLTREQIEQHIKFVENDPAFLAPSIRDRSINDRLYPLPGDTEQSSIHFTVSSDQSEKISLVLKPRIAQLTSMMMEQVNQLQLADGSFELNEQFAKLLLIDGKYLENLKAYLNRQGFNSFASNIREEILRLIATGIFLMDMLRQIPSSAQTVFLFPFDGEQIQSAVHLHLPQRLMPNIDRAIQFYREKRARYNIYCNQLELPQSTWDKFIQKEMFNISV